MYGLLLTFFAGAMAFASPEEELAQREAELLRLQREIEEQKKDILATKRQEGEVTTELNRLAQQVSLAEKDLQYINAQTEIAERHLLETQEALAIACDDVDDKTEMIHNRVLSLYDVGPAGYLEVLLGATDFSDFLSRIDNISAIIGQDVGQLNDLSEARQRLVDLKADIERRTAELASLRDEGQAKHSQLASRTADRNTYLSQIQRERQQMERALDELERTSQELIKIIQDLQIKSGVEPSKDGFNPIWPAVARISSPFGNRLHPVTKTYRMHTGIDIAVGMNTPVKAADSGVVIHASDTWLGGYGKTVIVDHGGGISTLYAHNNTINTKVGENVVQGQVISYSGTTGLSTGPHLHFEVRLDGTPVDPQKYLK